MGENANLAVEQAKSTLSLHGILPIVIAVIALALIVGVACLVKRRKPQPKPRPGVIEKPVPRDRPPVTPPGPTPEELAEVKRLTEQYCELLQEIEDRQAEEAYGRFFLKYGTVFQTLIGVAHRHAQEGMTEESCWSEMEIAMENSGILGQLDASGQFRISVSSGQIDRQAAMADCGKLSLPALREAVRGRRRVLEGYRRKMDFKALLAELGPVLQAVGQAYVQRDMGSCISACNGLRDILEENNCHCLFADDPAVLADSAIQVDFRNDYPQATELPGLYTRTDDGNYALIGACTGTRRAND